MPTILEKSSLRKQTIKGDGKCLATTGKKLIPIYEELIHKMIASLRHVITDTYQYYLCKTIFPRAYCCSLRTEEVVVSNTVDHTIKIEQIYISNKKLSLKINFILIML